MDDDDDFVMSDDDIEEPKDDPEMVMSESEVEPPSESKAVDDIIIKEDTSTHVRVSIHPHDSDSREIQSFVLEVDMTYEDLLHVISSTRDLKNPQDYAFYKGEPDDVYGGGGEKYDFAEAVQGGSRLVYLRINFFQIHVLHRGNLVAITVSPVFTLAQVREAFSTAPGGGTMDRSVQLSFEGTQITEEQTLSELGIRDGIANDPLCGIFDIHVRDDNAQLDNLMEVYDFWKVEAVIQSFCRLEKRNHRKSSQLFHQNVICFGYQTLYQLKPPIVNESVLIFEANVFNIEIRDHGGLTEYDVKDREKIVQAVEDHWTLATVKEQYSQRPEISPMLDADKFHLDEAVADETVMLYRLGLTEDSILYVERAEEAIAHEYICADCGADVLLKPEDAVRCRSCFYRIVYKKRTTRSCQYNCR